MAVIGNFSGKDGKWTGTIRTLTINAKCQFVPNETQGNGAPAFRVFAGGAELGAAWMKKANDTGRPYYSVKLDDPSFVAPIGAAFFPNEDEGTGVLVWNRPKPQPDTATAA